MVDFIKSLNAGLGAAKSAEENRAEIDAVFSELNRQLAEATGGKVALDRTQFQESGSFTVTFQPRMYWALAVFSTFPGINATEVAQWSMERSGYPCLIQMESAKWFCTDRPGLERALGLLLQDSFVGETIQRYIQMERPNI